MTTLLPEVARVLRLITNSPDNSPATGCTAIFGGTVNSSLLMATVLSNLTGIFLVSIVTISPSPVPVTKMFSCLNTKERGKKFLSKTKLISSSSRSNCRFTPCSGDIFAVPVKTGLKTKSST